MTPETFTRWIAEMKSAGRATSDSDCARLLGYRDVDRQKKRGGDYRLELACAALIAGLHGYRPADWPKGN